MPQDAPGGAPDPRAADDAAADDAAAAEVYDWYKRGLELLSGGSADAAAQLLERAVEREPGSASLREAYARALSDARRYSLAAEQWALLVNSEPHDDYARFGLGYTRYRLGDVEGAAEHLAMAVTMRPDRDDYRRALQQARATLRAREERDT
ncbi:tetratricopeptide repeat protein [Motilibacter peucedani]|uniref:Tetratricopeptide repeat protein n=1 Tax=Motilibacter peucedani TaxID=598650 RepID=A0A420XSK0_9ACTN|nr:tetratricopeptide repeat protein [Motilibacter peucedani]RKS77844.1 tetratricopeptide repeat protein [Motilibacter peucedani]